MSNHLKLCSEPVRTVMFRQICSYCAKELTYSVLCVYQLSTLACNDPQHRLWALRDAKAWLDRHRMVRLKDYREEPLFQETTLLSDYVTVKRTSGEIETDWVFPEPTFDEPVLIRCIDDVWTIPVLKPSEELKKHIPIDELKLSLPEEKHALVDELQSKLQMGFYSRESAAYDSALLEQESMENPIGVDTRDPPASCMELAFHPEHGYGLIFNPSRLSATAQAAPTDPK